MGCKEVKNAALSGLRIGEGRAIAGRRQEV